MTATPNLDLVKAWFYGDRSAPIHWPDIGRTDATYSADPPEWSDVATRRAVTITRCASGAPAQLPRQPKWINGKLIPPPPERRPRRPRPRRTR